MDELENTASTEITNDVIAKPNIAETDASEFAKRMEQIKQNVLAQASVEDKTFVKKVTETLKSAAVKNVEVEEKKAELEKQNVTYKSEILETDQLKNKHVAKEDKWQNKEKSRLYAYNGVKPIMKFVGIDEPLNMGLLIILTFILSPFFLLSKLLKGTIGVLISGACDQDRPKAVKGFLWTLIAVIAVLAIAIVIYLFLKWQGLILSN